MAPTRNSSAARTLPTVDDGDALVLRRGHPDRKHPWFLADDDNMPVSKPHTTASRVFADTLEAYVARALTDAAVFGNLAWRWDAAHRSRGVDPDVMYVTPAPPNAAGLRSLRAWTPGHRAPRLALEIVSQETATKDYVEAPLRYAAAKVHELVVFDPERHGRERDGGPYLVQCWRRARNGRMVLAYAGDGACMSDVLGAWLVPVDDVLRVADDPLGQSLWPTLVEVEVRRAETERNRAAQAGVRAEDERNRAAQAGVRAEAAQALASRAIVRLCERIAGRELTPDELVALEGRLREGDPEALLDQVAALGPAELATLLSG